MVEEEVSLGSDFYDYELFVVCVFVVKCRKFS